jgi:Na+/H+-dicarboxylate symporter
MHSKIKPYLFSIILFISIILGALTGYFYDGTVTYLKPFGDIFLNLIFVAIVPLIFFSISSAVVSMGSAKQLEKILSSMIFTFLFTSAIAAIFMIMVVKIFPPAEGVLIPIAEGSKLNSINFSQQIVNIFTVSDFSKLLSHQNMLPLIFFSILVGIGTLKVGEKGKAFALFLQAGADIFMKVISLIMYYAPIGFFAYFAVLIHDLGPQIIEGYVRVAIIYYVAAIIYFFIGFTFFAYLAGKLAGIKLFWKNAVIPSLTALATCSSAASIPVNLQATKNMGIPPAIYETAIPLGGILHKDGSVLGAITKIAFLFGVFHMSFTGPTVLITALLIALLVGSVMGAIPSGGMLGEMVILSMYGLPPQSLIIIAAISLIIDPIATMLNVTGNTVSTMLITRLVNGLSWIRKPSH